MNESFLLQSLRKKDPDLKVIEDNALVTVIESEIFDSPTPSHSDGVGEGEKMLEQPLPMTPHVRII